MSGIHVGIIMDGNGRWAKARRMPRWRGHRAGVESVRDVVRSSPHHGISTLTLYAFSADNWKRPAMEVGRLFWMLREYCRREHDELIENGVKVTAIGRRDRLPTAAVAAIEELELATRDCSTLHLRLALDYSSRWAIAQAAAALAKDVEQGTLAPEDISPDLLRGHITNGTPDVDLVIRTAGEKRLSDFLLWETAYAEFHYTSVLWPDFRQADLATAVSDFSCRERKYGALPADAPTAKAS